MASFPFARRYSENHCCFLFLWVLRCFSSPRYLYMTMNSSYSDWAFPSRVPPFGYLWITGYLLLTTAFRSLSRPSSAPGAKASSLRSSSLDLHFARSPSLSALFEVVSSLSVEAIRCFRIHLFRLKLISRVQKFFISVSEFSRLSID